MKCLLCGYRFDEEKAESSCYGCLLAGKCGLAKCPACGYETPSESGRFKELLNWRRKNGTKQKS